jgi:hypothetical protein
MQWFRMYAEFLTDPVVRMLAFEDQRHFVAALCMKASGSLDKEYPSPAIRRRALASLIGLSCETYDGKPVPFDEANRRLRELGLVDENWQPLNWDKRQFQSDSGAERMRKWRERHRDVTVTSPLRTRTEQIQNRTEQRKNGAPAPLVEGLDGESWAKWSAYRKGIGKAIKAPSINAAQKKLAGHGENQAAVVEHSIANGYVGLFAPGGSRPEPPPRTWRPDPNNPEDNGPC